MRGRPRSQVSWPLSFKRDDGRGGLEEEEAVIQDVRGRGERGGG